MIENALFWLAALTLALWLAGAVEMTRGTRRIRDLREIPPVRGEKPPAVSVVIAARDEARGVREALQTVLAQAYPGLEVVVVDDRSRDGTGEILDRMAARDPRLRVVHLHELPDGWLGKNHALQRGAELAGGEWILFSDADVVMQPTALARAIGYATRGRVDHLAVAPELKMPGWLLDVFGGTFAIFFARFARPWKARDPRSRRHVGVGAFNLVRAGAYRSAGGHRPIAMRPDDDLKLGKLLKQRGCAQDILFGRGLVSVEWYSSLGETVRGLEKNTFAGLEYSVAAVLTASAALLLFDVWPFAALLLTTGPTRLLNAAVVLVVLAVYAVSARRSGANPLLAPAFPLAALLLVGIVLRSTALALKNGGIRWRGTLYPLEQLRANRV